MARDEQTRARLRTEIDVLRRALDELDVVLGDPQGQADQSLRKSHEVIALMLKLTADLAGFS